MSRNSPFSHLGQQSKSEKARVIQELVQPKTRRSKRTIFVDEDVIATLKEHMELQRKGTGTD